MNYCFQYCCIYTKELLNKDNNLKHLAQCAGSQLFHYAVCSCMVLHILASYDIFQLGLD